MHRRCKGPTQTGGRCRTTCEAGGSQEQSSIGAAVDPARRVASEIRPWFTTELAHLFEVLTAVRRVGVCGLAGSGGRCRRKPRSDPGSGTGSGTRSSPRVELRSKGMMSTEAPQEYDTRGPQWRERSRRCPTAITGRCVPGPRSSVVRSAWLGRGDRQGMNTDLILDSWELALLIITWSVIGLVSIKRRYDWRHRRFTQQVN